MDAIKIQEAIRQIWGSESHNVSVLLDVQGRFHAECEVTYQRRWLSESTYIQTLNDMFCDYCTEKCAWEAYADPADESRFGWGA